jgi:hypothetical protein
MLTAKARSRNSQERQAISLKDSGQKFNGIPILTRDYNAIYLLPVHLADFGAYHELTAPEIVTKPHLNTSQSGNVNSHRWQS